MSLTSYQQAVLQEMGIPVWITKDAYTELKQEDQAKQNNANAAQRNVGTPSSSSAQIPYSQNAQANKPPSTPISQEEKQSRLAQLRANVGSSAKDKAKPKDGGAAKLSTLGASHNEGKVGQTETGASQSHNTSPSYDNAVASQESLTKSIGAKGPVSPEGIPLSAEQKAKSQQWLKDLQLACVQLGIPSQWASTIMIGRTLSVTETAIILPATPLKLTAVQKRELWAQLISAARELNHSANGQ
ncbi:MULTISPECIES: alanine acetyltransferase [unclassified Alteromonas]|uniref:alanine acetyltransferase n=1 Tax=unclassified Alteromonas TaxID=2614992 RepID=UPI001EF22CED|nr:MULTISPECIES: alanine acetyltransferase [unclassified Alteromonas]MCG7637330.1 alanine acetyltransferase [Alteromonas sp. CNT1-28]MCG7813185.1 alanine acetyltransferase [Alteromonas sp. MCA-1]